MEHYSKQQGFDSFAPEMASREELDQFVKWLNFQSTKSQLNITSRRWPSFDPLIFRTFSSKVITLSQRHCTICDGCQPTVKNYPVSVFAIRIPPISKQAAGKDFNIAFKKAIQHSLTDRVLIPSVPDKICLALTFILHKSRRDKDVDNMAKALVDALASALKFNDSRVQHLDVLKLIFPEAEEFVKIRIAPSHLNNHENVLAPIFAHDWAGAPKYELVQFALNSLPNET